MKTLLTILAALALAASVNAQLIPTTQKEQDLQELSSNVNAALYYSQLWANSLNKIGSVWSLEDSRLEQVLETLGQERVTQLIALQQAQAQVLNAGFQAAGVSTRVQSEPTRRFSWASPTNVVIVPLPTPTPEPTSEPTPSE
jgi:hypothetical protein